MMPGPIEAAIQGLLPSTPSGPYTVWENYGTEGWKPTDYPTLQEAVAAHKFCSEWVVMRSVKWEAVDKTDEPQWVTVSVPKDAFISCKPLRPIREALKPNG